MLTRFLPEAMLMRTLSHPVRLAIVTCLGDGPACVCHLTAVLQRPQAYLSQQLALLRTAGVIDAQRDGMFVFYRLRDPRTLRLLDLAGRLSGSPAPSPAPGRAPDCGCPRCRPPAAPLPEGGR